MTFQFPVQAGTVRVTLIAVSSLLLLAAGNLPGTAPVPVTAPAATVLPVVIDTTAVAAEIAANNDELTAPLAVPAPAAERPVRLAALVDEKQVDMADDSDLRCLATAVYFEARGEPLEGQLAVAQAILNRVASGRYAGTACGVIHQAGQFSFSAARSPRIGNDWRIAQAIAAIAQDKDWQQVAPRATSFHATFVKPGWTRMTRVAQIGNHVFYR